MAKYIRKTVDEWQISQFLFGRWEEVSAADNRKEARQITKEYRTNQPEFRVRCVKKRIKKEVNDAKEVDRYDRG